MRRAGLCVLTALIVTAALMPGRASSHREAPLIAQDPMADNTDVYAFVDPNDPDFVTLIANFIPLQKPDGGPNFYQFDPNVVYEIHIDNNADAVEDITYPVAVHDRDSQSRHVPLRHGSGDVARRSGPQRAPVLSPACASTARAAPARRANCTPACRWRRRTSARARSRTTPRSPAACSSSRRPAIASSPVSVTKASSSTSRCSTCSASARTASRTAPPDSTSTPSRSRCRSAS